MPVLTGKDLIDAGWPEGPLIGQMLDRARELESEKGITDPKYLLKLLKRDFKAPPPKAAMRSAPVPLAEAIEPAGPGDEENIAAVRRQMRELLRVPVIAGGAVMPDACPAGAAPATIPVGGAIAVENAIIPSAHSADICCSMFATFYRCESPVGDQLDALAAATRFGMGGRKPDDLVAHPVVDEPVWDNPFLKGLQEKARIHIADQGDGNHFAYIGELDASHQLLSALRDAGYDDLAGALDPAAHEPRRQVWNVLVTHHGSRGLGAHVYKRGQNAALKHTARIAHGIPASAAWLDADEPDGAAYWEALQYVSRWTRANHESIHRRFLERIGAKAAAAFGNEHNFVWKRGSMFLHGKGATPAWKDDQDRPLLGLIPLNMASPILLVLGGDNEQFLSFAPHGAGRNISRRALRRQFQCSKSGTPDTAAIEKSIRESTAAIDVRWFYGKPDLSETPVAYKPAEQVRTQIEKFRLAKVVAEITPLGSIMAGDPGPFVPWKKRREQELTPKQKRQIEHRSDRRKNRQKLRQADEIE